MRVKPRLAKLETAMPRGCHACRDWCEVVLVDDFGATQRPERCAGCGRLVPIRTLVRLVGVRLDLI